MSSEVLSSSTSVSATELPKPTSQKKIQANRKNAIRSTGPKTARGKATVARNAVKHSILAREVINSDPEDEAEKFEELLAQLIEEYQPACLTEKLLVERLLLSGGWRSESAL